MREQDLYQNSRQWALSEIDRHRAALRRGDFRIWEHRASINGWRLYLASLRADRQRHRRAFLERCAAITE